MLDEAKSAKEKAKSTFAAIQSTKWACLKRMIELDKQEAWVQTVSRGSEEIH